MNWRASFGVTAPALCADSTILRNPSESSTVTGSNLMTSFSSNSIARFCVRCSEWCRSSGFTTFSANDNIAAS